MWQVLQESQEVLEKHRDRKARILIGGYQQERIMSEVTFKLDFEGWREFQHLEVVKVKLATWGSFPSSPPFNPPNLFPHHPSLPLF